MRRDTINNRLSKLAQKQDRRTGWVDQVWSNDLIGAIKYTAFRSRGYLYRNLSHRMIDLIETLGLALIVHPDLVKAIYSFSICSIASSFFLSVALHCIRSASLLKQRVSPQSFLRIIHFLIFLTYASTLFYFWNAEMGSYLVTICISKYFMSLVTAKTGLETAEVTSTQRVYFPPWLNFAGIFVTTLAVWLGFQLREASGFYIILSGSFVMQLLTQFIPFNLAKRARQTLRLFGRYAPDTYTQVPNRMIFVERATIAFSPYIAPLLLTLFSQTNALWILSWIWGSRLLADAVISRPFRSIYIDIHRAFEKQHWELLELRLYFATRFSAVFFGIFALIVFASSAAHLSFSYFVFFAWILLITANQALLARFVASGSETIFLNLIGVTRYVLGPLLFLLLKTSTPPLAFAFAISEALTLVALLLKVRKVSLTSYCEYAAAREDARVGRVLWTLNDFFNSYRLVSPLLRRFGLPEGIYLVTLNKRLGGEGQVQRFLNAFQGILRKTDRLALLDHRHLVVWAPLSRHIEVIRNRALERFPLLITDFRESNGLDLLKQVKQELNIVKPSPIVFHNKTALLSLLDTSLNNSLKECGDGKWWALTPRGWLSLEGYADPVRTKTFFKVYERAERELILQRNKMRKSDELEEHIVPFSPCGKLIALYTTTNLNLDVIQAIKEVKAAFLEWEGLTPVAPKEPVKPGEWFALQQLLDHLIVTKRADIHYRVALAGTQLGPNEIRCAVTSNGQSHLELVVRFGQPITELPQKSMALESAAA